MILFANVSYDKLDYIGVGHGNGIGVDEEQGMKTLTHWGRVTHISSVQITACRLAGAKPLSEPMLEYC